MDSYSIFLFIHIAAAVVWVGGGAVMQFFGLRIQAANDPDRLAAFGADIEWIGTRVFAPASLIAALTGVALVLDGPWSFGDGWILFGILLYAVTFLAGLLFFGPESGRLGKLIDERGLGSPEVGARLARLTMLTRLDLVLLFLIIYDMTVKPADFADYALGIVAALVAAAIVYWRSSFARPAPAGA